MGRRVWRGFCQELAPVGGIGLDIVEVWRGFAEKGSCEGSVMAAWVKVRHPPEMISRSPFLRSFNFHVYTHGLRHK